MLLLDLLAYPKVFISKQTLQVIQYLIVLGLLSFSDQGSTYSGDLESEARSTPFSWADAEDPGANVKPLVASSEREEPVVAPTIRTEPLPSEQPDLEKDFPRGTLMYKKFVLGLLID